MALAAFFFEELDVKVSLQLNSLGCLECRPAFRQNLLDFLQSKADDLCTDCRRRITTNPLRVLDCKNDSCRELVKDAPSILEHLCSECETHFELVKSALQKLGVEYSLNKFMVRGLDYYGRTVFEWTTEVLGSQGTICGGGRYDGLVDHLGGKSTPGVGFALGMERVVLLMEALEVIPDTYRTQADVYLMAQQQACEEAIRKLARLLRQEFPALRVLTHIGGGSLKSQLKRADKSGALFGLIIGQSELESGHIVCKPLRGGEQETLSEAGLLKRMSILRDM